VAVDYCNNLYLLGLRCVPLIPNSIGILLSELQTRAYGIKVDSCPRSFGGKGQITINDSVKIPLYLERGLMTCPIRKPTLDEIDKLQIHWLTSDHAWDPTVFDEFITTKDPIPQGYHVSGHISSM